MDISSGCFSTGVRSTFPLAAALVLASILPSEARAQNSEYVRVHQVEDDNLIIVRSNGAMYSIEKGVGCLSAWRYEGKQALIISPGVFLGVGSRLLLPDDDQECRIWDHEILSPGQVAAPPKGTTKTVPGQPGAAQPTPSRPSACYESTIMSPSPFMGNNGEVFRLADGSMWEVKYEYEYLYEYLPDVVICPATGRLAVAGKTLNVQQVGSATSETPSPSPSSSTSAVIESQIDGEFEGWTGETIFKLTNGQIWQQASYAYTYHYAFRPEVLIYQSSGVYKMRVEGVDTQITVRRLR